MTDEIHSCSYYCDRIACIKAQRDELVRKYVEAQSEWPSEGDVDAIGVALYIHWNDVNEQARNAYRKKIRAALMSVRPPVGVVSDQHVMVPLQVAWAIAGALDEAVDGLLAASVSRQPTKLGRERQADRLSTVRSAAAVLDMILSGPPYKLASRHAPTKD